MDVGICLGPLQDFMCNVGTAKAAKMALSNMLGGLGYFYGSSKIKLPGGIGAAGPIVVESWPAALYTGVPSRSFFSFCLSRYAAACGYPV
ncbi:MAG: hypothetical protein EOP49_17245 [Sphingobacteriales bacterium]|nr:MAG: hypothetical protein EOP49_17245 [Sphingobacteriales bacterium]